jgi:hypothetical protein
VTRTRLLPVAFLVPAVALLGCSRSDKLVPAKVSGNITYNGQPIKAGNINFFTTDGVAYPGVISSDGTYSASDLPEGDFVVTVETEHLNPARKVVATGKDYDRRMKTQQQQRQDSAPPPAEPYIKIPEKYAKSNTSTLSVSLTRGRQVKDLELTP